MTVRWPHEAPRGKSQTQQRRTREKRQTQTLAAKTIPKNRGLVRDEMRQHASHSGSANFSHNGPKSGVTCGPTRANVDLREEGRALMSDKLKSLKPQTMRPTSAEREKAQQTIPILSGAISSNPHGFQGALLRFSHKAVILKRQTRPYRLRTCKKTLSIQACGDHPEFLNF